MNGRRSKKRSSSSRSSLPNVSRASINLIAAPSSELLPTAARALVVHLRPRLPDLRDAVVLLPTLHAAPGFARELCAAAGMPALLLPRITTLSAWAAGVALDSPVTSAAARQAMLYRVLGERGWLKEGDLWSVAAELGALFDELTRKSIELPRNLRDFTRQLEKAYSARSSGALNFEARLVHELWHVAVAGGEALDPQAAYHTRLARLAKEVAAPVYAVGLEDLSRSEQQFLARIAERVSVACFEIDRTSNDAVTRTFALAWPETRDAPDLLTRAAELEKTHRRSPLAGRLRTFAASSAEQEAQAVDVTVREWLLQGKKNIAVVVNDRLTARRARALLERAQVLVEDEAGWAFSTTSAATAIGRWLDVVANDSYYRDLFDLLKSPFAFFDRPRDHRQRAVWRLESYAREKSVATGLTHFIALAERRHDHEVLLMLKRIERGIAALGRGRRPIARWLQGLLASLGLIGVAEGLAADSAGEQLLDLLERLKQELAGEPLPIAFSEWRRWLARELETATFRDRAITSPVVFTHLGAARVRRFDAVLLLGCDAAHLPGPDPAVLFFNQGVRTELGLSASGERVAKVERDLAALLACADTAVATWQCRSGAGEPNLLSPQLERLTALHRLAYGDGLEDKTLTERLPRAEVRFAGAVEGAGATGVPAPTLPATLIPSRVSASAYNTLMACPYQFYARYVLGLAELDDVQEEIEKRDYGELVHDVLAQFHRAHPRVLEMDAIEAQRELESLSEQAFSEVTSRNYLARAWLMRWLALIPKYIEWQREHERAGWSWHASEVAREVEMVTPKGRRFLLRGRLDRVDLNGDGSSAVIDYKTQAMKVLRDKVAAHGEDVQLPVYALLWGGPVGAALFLSLDRDGVKPVPVEESPGELAEAARSRLATLYDALHEGARLTAQGVEAVCEHCEMRGLCRRNYWP